MCEGSTVGVPNITNQRSGPWEGDDRHGGIEGGGSIIADEPRGVRACGLAHGFRCRCDVGKRCCRSLATDGRRA